MPTSAVKLVLVELLGTFFLALLVGILLINAGTNGYASLYLPIGASTAIGLFAYCFPETDLGSFNPAVALGRFLVRRITGLALLLCVVAELVGAYLGILLARYLSDAPLLAPQGYGVRADIGELLGTALYVFVTVRLAYGQIVPAASGLAVGSSLLIGLSIAQAVSGGLLNPALAIGFGSFHISYLLMPLLGGVIGALLARSLRPPIATYA